MAANKLYDRFHHLNSAVSANGMHVAAQLNVAPELQRREGLLNARIMLSFIFPGESAAAAEALVRMKHRLHAKVDPHHSFLGDLFTIAKQPANTMNVKHVLKRHRAQLYIESTLGKGTLFRCDFPPEMIVTEERAADLSHSA